MCASKVRVSCAWARPRRRKVPTIPVPASMQPRNAHARFDPSPKSRRRPPRALARRRRRRPRRNSSSHPRRLRVLWRRKRPHARSDNKSPSPSPNPCVRSAWNLNPSHLRRLTGTSPRPPHRQVRHHRRLPRALSRRRRQQGRRRGKRTIRRAAFVARDRNIRELRACEIDQNKSARRSHLQVGPWFSGHVQLVPPGDGTLVFGPRPVGPTWRWDLRASGSNFLTISHCAGGADIYCCRVP